MKNTDKILEEIAYIVGETYPLDKDGLNDFLDTFMPKIDKIISQALLSVRAEALAEERDRVRGEIEGVIGLKYKLFGAAGCSRDEEIKEELREAKDPRTVLDRFSSLTINGVGFAGSGGNWDTELLLPDTVFQYTEDILGRKVYQTIRNKE